MTKRGMQEKGKKGQLCIKCGKERASRTGMGGRLLCNKCFTKECGL
jgi:hypothetical protein